MWGLGSSTLDKAATVKLTRTLAIIPITLALSYIVGKKEEAKENLGLSDKEGFSLKRAFPTFIGFFIIASIITTIATSFGADPSLFVPLKEISKFLIVMAMLAIGLNSDIVKLVKTGGKPLLLGASCWIAITLVSLLLQRLLGIW